MRITIFRRDNGHCQECGRKLTWKPDRPDSYHLGHRHARGVGGSDALENLQAECRDCNLRKGMSSSD